MTFAAYMLRCADGSFYVGHAEDMEARFTQHNAGTVHGYTRTRLPVLLEWHEMFPTREEAIAAERQLKGWSRAKKEALIRGDWAEVRTLARRSSRSTLRDEASASSASPQDDRSAESGHMGLCSAHSDEGASRGKAPSGTTPIIVLVRPQLGENIGKAARAMLNFGLTELRLVAPRDGWPNPQAGPAASGADIVLERAREYANVAEAVADCAHVYATTVRKRGVTKPVVTPDAAAAAIHAEPGRTAILFGPERSGLETDDVALARTILTVPINPEFGSLNLAQAVILVAYEWSRHGARALAQPPATELLPPAQQEELDGMIAQLDAMLETSGYYYPPDRVPATRRMLRTLLTKPGWNSQEVRTLRGVLSALARPRPRG